MTTIFTDDRCLEHQVPWGFPETPARLRAVLAALREGDWVIRDQAHHDEVLATMHGLHDERYVERFRRAVERGDGLLDSADNPLSPDFVTVTPDAGGGLSHGDVVTLTATPPAGWSFVGYEGDITDTSETVVHTMTANASVTARFQRQQGGIH